MSGTGKTASWRIRFQCTFDQAFELAAHLRHAASEISFELGYNTGTYAANGARHRRNRRALSGSVEV